MKAKKFIYAGIDFIFDENLNPYFLEANSCPGLKGWYEIHKDFKPLEKLTFFLKSRNVETVGVLTSRRNLEEEFPYIVKNLLQKLNLKVHICLIESNIEKIEENSNSLINIENELVHLDAIFLRNFLPTFNPKSTIMINPPCIMKITRDKWLTYKAVKKYKQIKIPKSFLIKTTSELKEILMKKIFTNGIVVKPRVGEKGKHINIFPDINKVYKFEIKRESIVQEYIPVKRVDNKFWDIRVFVVCGKFIGAIKRVSNSRVVNLTLGGKTEKVEDSLIRKIRPLSEICVKAIESFKLFKK